MDGFKIYISLILMLLVVGIISIITNMAVLYITCIGLMLAMWIVNITSEFVDDENVDIYY